MRDRISVNSDAFLRDITVILLQCFAKLAVCDLRAEPADEQLFRVSNCRQHLQVSTVMRAAM
jgi:hypothetical protein